MNAERLLAHYERIADAPDAIARLRRFILDLAVRGKLVPQDPKDEPASELLKRIEKEKTRLVKAGQIKTPKPIPVLPEPPFPIPTNWHWSQIAEIGILSPRNEAPDAMEASFVPMPLIAAEYGVAHEHEIRPWGEIKKGYTHFAEGDVGLAKITPCFENGKSTVFRNLTGGIGSGTTELHVVRPLFVDQDYILLFLKSPHFIETGIPKMTGTAGQKRVPTEYFAHSPFPLPPLAEQQRIVAKVEELMALCDRLEVARVEREATRDRLTAASLARLNAPDPETFQADARFALDALPSLTTRPDQIKQLRQTILNLAVRGKLVPQDTDEVGPDLPDQAERRTAEGKFNFDIPANWSWARVSEVASARLGKMLDKAKNRGDRYPYLRNTNVHWFDIRTDDVKQIPLARNEAEDYLLQRGDVLICEGGHGIGRSAVWRGREEPMVFQKALHRVRAGIHLDPDFFSFCCFVYFHEGIMQTYFTGVGIPHFTGKALARLIFPLPPLAEQRRIVIKVNELMALCDRLEASLTTASETRRRLLEALLAEALAPVDARELEAAE
jgi:type I restriction enzyme S subunit